MKYLINLLPEKEQNATDRIIYFSFHYLRYILVITQFVAICVFFYRFKVDQDIVDLKDALTQKRAIVDATKSLLDEVAKLDKKMSYLRGVLVKQDTMQKSYTYILASLPLDIQIKRLSIKDATIELEGITKDINSVKKLYEKIQTDKNFLQVSLSSINKTRDGYTFKLTMSKFNEKS